MFSVTVNGNLGSDMKHEMAGQTPLLKVGLAVYAGKDGAGEAMTEWINLQFWKKWMLEKLPTEFRKGDRVVVTGQLKFNRYLDKNNFPQNGFTIDVQEIVLQGSTKDRAPVAGPAPGAGGGAPAGWGNLGGGQQQPAAAPPPAGLGPQPPAGGTGPPPPPGGATFPPPDDL